MFFLKNSFTVFYGLSFLLWKMLQGFTVYLVFYYVHISIFLKN